MQTLGRNNFGGHDFTQIRITLDVNIKPNVFRHHIQCLSQSWNSFFLKPSVLPTAGIQFLNLFKGQFVHTPFAVSCSIYCFVMHQHQLAVFCQGNIKLNHLSAQKDRFAKCSKRVFRVRIAGTAVSANSACWHRERNIFSVYQIGCAANDQDGDQGRKCFDRAACTLKCRTWQCNKT